MLENESDILAKIKNELTTALNRDDGAVSRIREENYNAYYGLGQRGADDEDRDSSTYISREVFETVEWALSSIMKALAGTTSIVSFTGHSAEDEKLAEQETALVNHYIWKENRGYETMYNWVKEMLFYPNSYIKVWPEEKKSATQKQVSGLLMPDVERYGESLEITGQEEVGGLITYSGTLTEEKSENRIRIMNLPPESLLIGRNISSVDLDTADFIAHRMFLNKTELRDMGLSEDDITMLSDGGFEDSEEINREIHEDEGPKYRGEKLLYDIFIKFEGKSYRVLYGNKSIIQIEEDDYNPFIAASAIMIPQKHTGMSYIEPVRDIQDYSTILAQQMLNNVVKIVTKRHFIWADAISVEHNTIDAYLDNRADLVPVDMPPANAIMPEQTTPVLTEIAGARQEITKSLEVRSGVAPSLSLNPESLSASSRESYQQAVDEASQRLKLLLSNFVEVSFSKLVAKVHNLIRLHINTPISLKIRGDFIQLDPTTWKERPNTQSSVGIGHISKNEKLVHYASILDLQKEAIQFNLSDHKKIFNTLEKMTQTAGIGPAELYFIDPSKPIIGPDGQQQPWQPPEPPPDPHLIIAQAQAVVLQAEARYKDVKGQVEQAELLINQASTKAEIEKAATEQKELASEIEKTRASLMQAQEELNSKVRVLDSTAELNRAKVKEILNEIANPERVSKPTQ